ncbi:MAG: shikimate kinase [Parachlamydiaceae bacterium]
MQIILIGFMGCGKSSVAKKLSSMMEWPILEMDDQVLKKIGVNNMEELFAKGGELLLRETEIAIAKEYVSRCNTIISTGGGVVLNKIVLDYFKKKGGIIYFLNATFDTICSHLSCDTSRPLFKNRSEANALYHFRLPLYLKYADYVIEVDQKSIQSITEEIAENILIQILA